MQWRSINQRILGSEQFDGAGVRLVRVIGRANTSDFDPFLMLDAFDSNNPEDYTRGFPMHPHRGIETITYLLHGKIEHKDSLGNQGSIGDGDCQWMTAGHGILHQEMPQAAARFFGLQLWLNLPRANKLDAPHYRDVPAAAIPTVRQPGRVTHIIGGDYLGTSGAAHGHYVDMQFLDVELEAGAEWQISTPTDNTAFAYVFSGSLTVGDGRTQEGPKRALLFTIGDALRITAGPSGARLAFLSAPPLREPIAWGGPIVMNTAADLRQAWQDMRDGTFIRKP